MSNMLVTWQQTLEEGLQLEGQAVLQQLGKQLMLQVLLQLQSWRPCLRCCRQLLLLSCGTLEWWQLCQAA